MCLPALLCLLSSTVEAAYLSQQDRPNRLVLPDLAAPPPPPVSKVMDRHRALVGYHAKEEQWKVGLEYPNHTSSAFKLDYGINLSSDFALGTNVAVGQNRRDVVLNGYFAPASDLRLRVAGGQLQQTNDFAFASGNQAGSVRQDNYLVDAKKYWHRSLLSDVGLSAYGAHAQDQRLDPKIIASDHRILIDPRELAAGTMQGYQLNLGLAPLPGTRLEIGRSVSQVSYQYANGTEANEQIITNRARYIHQLDRCIQLQGGYDNAPYGDRVDIGLRKNSWNVGLSRMLARDNNAADFAFRVNYAIPLGKTTERPLPCQPAPHMLPVPKATAVEVANRPLTLPGEAMVRVDPTVTLTPSPENGH